jgi:peptidyl-prolyl cis-trans isomerase A (cyclophilin A)
MLLFAGLLVALACHSSAPLAGPTPAPAGQYTADIQTDFGTITVALFPDKAPLAVGNFIGLTEGTQAWRDPRSGAIEQHKRFYDGLTFHRVIPNFMIQGGDAMGNGSGSPGYQFANETSPDLLFDRPGRLAMANAGPDTNGSQFFITVAPYPSLNGNYTIFGQVLTGQSVADAISKVPTHPANNMPLTPVHIIKITIHRS